MRKKNLLLGFNIVMFYFTINAVEADSLPIRKIQNEFHIGIFLNKDIGEKYVPRRISNGFNPVGYYKYTSPGIIIGHNLKYNFNKSLNINFRTEIQRYKLTIKYPHDSLLFYKKDVSIYKETYNINDTILYNNYIVNSLYLSYLIKNLNFGFGVNIKSLLIRRTEINSFLELQPTILFNYLFGIKQQYNVSLKLLTDEIHFTFGYVF